MLTFNKTHRRSAGDTLIEVLFAITIFSFIVVTALSLMNQGVAASQRSLETTLVRQQIDGQAEVLRFLHQSYVQAYQSGQTFNLTDGVSSPAEEYYKIIQFVSPGGLGSRTYASPFGATAKCIIPSDVNKDFVINPVAAKFTDVKVNPTVFKQETDKYAYPQLVYGTGNALASSQGMWVEAVRSPVVGTTAGYIDFHIRACWNVIGSDIPMNLGTIVRLYEPRT